jgi:hypothetical protein
MLTPRTVIDRINTWTKKRRRELRDERRGRIAINRSGIEIHKLRTVSDAEWADIERITATKVDVFMGDIISLTVLTKGGNSGQVSEHDPEWYDLIEAISEHLPGSLPYANWALNLVAGTAPTILVYQAPSVSMIVRRDV